jgi:hypothetical protein
MSDAPRLSSSGSAAAGGAKGLVRQDRLKAALKANIARRKAQAKARQDEDRPGPGAGDLAQDGSGPMDRQQDNE